jgi:hypothetical protein
VTEKEDAMRSARYCLAILACLLPVLIAPFHAAAQTSVQQTMKKFNCAKDRSGVTFCQRVAPAGRYSGQEGVYTEKSEGKTCKWKCRTEQGIETCQGSGPECAGKAPPHWR